MADPKPPTIVAVDLLRFACALLVVWNHYALAMWFDTETRVSYALRDIDAAPRQIARAGLVGVELFFVISGLMIAHSAANAGWLEFLRRRLLRLAPAAWICATLTVLVLAANGQADAQLLGDWWRSMRFWPVGGQVDGSYWTLGVESAFYLLVALAATGSGSRILRLGWALALASGAFWATCLTLGTQAGAVITNQAATLLLLPHGCFFAIGIGIAHRDTRGGTPLLILALATAAVEMIVHVGAGRWTPAALLAQAIFACGVLALAAAPILQPWLTRRIDLAHARTIGLMTYPLYLLHQNAGAVLVGALARSGVPNDGAILLTLIAMLAASWLIAIHAEPFVRGRLAHLLSLRRALPLDTLRSASPPAG